MRVTRLFVEAPLQPGTRIAVPDAASTHLLRVLRAGIGDACVLFNGDGHDYAARIVAVDKRTAIVDVLSSRRLANESPLRITLLQALARGEKMDWILQKATELGVTSVVPVASERTEVKLDGERSAKRATHWKSVVVSACEQSGRATLPKVCMPSALGPALLSLPEGAHHLLLDPQAAQGLGGIELPPGTSLVLAVGPEGGWSPRDLALLAGAGFSGLRLGPRVLRTETAGIAAIAALQSRLGDLG